MGSDLTLCGVCCRRCAFCAPPLPTILVLRAPAGRELAARRFRVRCRRCVLLHGGMRVADKEAAISAHRSGQAPVMVCTSVVEVGVDVPEASIMVVQQADR